MEFTKFTSDILTDEAITHLKLYDTDKDVINFVKTLDSKQLCALNIAINQLGSSFDIKKSIGFINFNQKGP